MTIVQDRNGKAGGRRATTMTNLSIEMLPAGRRDFGDRRQDRVLQ